MLPIGKSDFSQTNSLIFKMKAPLTPSLLADVGLSDIPGEAMVKLYCPKCMDVYTPKSSRHHHTDGAYFGTGFPHMLFMVHPEYRPKRPANQFVPRFVQMLLIVCSKDFHKILNRGEMELDVTAKFLHLKFGLFEVGLCGVFLCSQCLTCSWFEKLRHFYEGVKLTATLRLMLYCTFILIFTPKTVL